MNVDVSFLVAAIALISPETDPYTLLCEAESSQGFHFEAGDYTPQRFLPEKFLVTVRPENECNVSIDQTESLYGDISVREACVNIRSFGDAYMADDSQRCTEIFDATVGKVIQLQCYSRATIYRFMPDGRFLWASITGPLDPRGPPPEDDIVVGWGICGIVS